MGSMLAGGSARAPKGENELDRNDDVNEFWALGPMTSFLEIHERDLNRLTLIITSNMVLRADVRYTVQLGNLQLLSHSWQVPSLIFQYDSRFSANQVEL